MPSSLVGMSVQGKLCGKENILARPQERRRKSRLRRSSDDNMDLSILRKGQRTCVNQYEINKLKSISVKTVSLELQGPTKYEVEYNETEPSSVVHDN